MRKIYCVAMVAIMAVMLGSCRDDEPRWSDFEGSWQSVYYADQFGEYEIYGSDVVRYDFYRDGTGRYTFYSMAGLSFIDFDWEFRNNRLYIDYYDNTYEVLYCDYDRYGYLLLSPSPGFREYTAYGRVY